MIFLNKKGEKPGYLSTPFFGRILGFKITQ